MFLTPQQLFTYDTFRACATDSAYLDQMLPNGGFTFHALTQYDAKLIKKCMENQGFNFNY